MNAESTLVCSLCRRAANASVTSCPQDGQALDGAHWQPVPTPLHKRFRVLQPFAQGGTGSLYLADESETGRRGVLKILAPIPKHREAERARLRRELSKQAGVASQHLVVPWASGESEGTTWLFRPQLEGVSLRVRLQHGPVPAAEALSVAVQLAAGLDDLHRSGLLHRDVKPGHVILRTDRANNVRAALIDAGVCSCLTRAGNSTIFGTPGYVAPEQLQGKLVSFRSDLYSFGCMMYEMLRGLPPFAGDSADALLASQLSGEIPPLEVELPDSVHALLRSLLAREAQERPFSAQKLRRLLDLHALDGAPMNRRPTTTFGMPPSPTLQDGASPDHEATSTAPSLPPPPPPAALRASTPSSAPSRLTTRGLAPPPPPPPSRPPSSDATQQVELDQLLELDEHEIAPLAPSSAGPKDTLRGHAKPVRADHTEPIRLEQVLAVAPAKMRPSVAPPPSVDADRAASVEVVEVAASASNADSSGSAGAASTPPEGNAEAAIERASDTAPAPQPSALFGAPDSAPATAPRSLAPELTMEIDADYLARAGELSAAVPEPAPEASAQNVSEMPSTSLFADAPLSPDANPFRAAFEQDDDDEGERTQVAERPQKPRSVPPEGAALQEPRVHDDEDPTFIRPASLAPTAAVSHAALPESELEQLEPRRLQDTLHPYGRRAPAPSQRKYLMWGGAAALLGLLALGVGAMGGEEAPPTAARDMPSTSARPAAVQAPATPEEAPTAAALATAPGVEDETTVEAAGPMAAPEAMEADPGADPQMPTAMEAQPEPRSPSETGSSGHAVKAERSEYTSTRSTRSERRRGRRERRASSAANERTAQWAEARDQARAHYAAKRFKQAAQAYERAAEYDPTHAGTFAGLGASRLQLGDSKGAVTAYQRAIQLSPSSAGFHVALGRAYVAAGDKSKARAEYKRALTLDPKNEGAKESLKEIGG